MISLTLDDESQCRIHKESATEIQGWKNSATEIQGWKTSLIDFAKQKSGEHHLWERKR